MELWEYNVQGSMKMNKNRVYAVYCTYKKLVCIAFMNRRGAWCLSKYVVGLKRHENLQPLIASSGSETQSSMRDFRLPTLSR